MAALVGRVPRAAEAHPCCWSLSSAPGLQELLQLQLVKVLAHLEQGNHSEAGESAKALIGARPRGVRLQLQLGHLVPQACPAGRRQLLISAARRRGPSAQPCGAAGPPPGMCCGGGLHCRGGRAQQPGAAEPPCAEGGSVQQRDHAAQGRLRALAAGPPGHPVSQQGRCPGACTSMEHAALFSGSSHAFVCCSALRPDAPATEGGWARCHAPPAHRHCSLSMEHSLPPAGAGSCTGAAGGIGRC